MSTVERTGVDISSAELYSDIGDEYSYEDEDSVLDESLQNELPSEDELDGLIGG